MKGHMKMTKIFKKFPMNGMQKNVKSDLHK